MMRGGGISRIAGNIKVIGEEETLDLYERYDELYERRYGDRRAERRTKPKYATVSERKRDEILAEVTEGAEELELGFHPSYQPSRHEQGWLLSSLRGFYDQGLISDVLARVKGGKEANVYLCQGPAASPSPSVGEGLYEGPSPSVFQGEGWGERASSSPFQGEACGEDPPPSPFQGEGWGEGHSPSPFQGEGWDEGRSLPFPVPRPRRDHPALLAAKVYRPRMFRNLRNDALYRQGREVMVVGGKAAGKQASTIARAIRNKSGFGLEAAHTSWLMHEYVALGQLYRAGGAVPRPWGGNENAILMEMIGDERQAAPTLSSVSLGRREARRLLDEVLRNVELMLANDLIHADLSAYNILYWEGKITLIDFPQVVHPSTNPDARWILLRDLTRVSEYFEDQDAGYDPAALARELWDRAARDSVGGWLVEPPPVTEEETQ